MWFDSYFNFLGELNNAFFAGLLGKSPSLVPDSAVATYESQIAGVGREDRCVYTWTYSDTGNKCIASLDFTAEKLYYHRPDKFMYYGAEIVW